MADDVLSPREVEDTNTLKSLFDDAYMDTSLDNDGDLHVDEDGLGCYVLPINEGSRIKLLAVWQARSGSTRSKRLEFANRVNEGIITVRVSISDDVIFFDHYIPVEGGITKKAIVLATKHFLNVQKSAIVQCGGQDVLA